MSQDNDFLIIIPVRLASTRLPNKPLVDICGKTMIHRVYEKAIEAKVGEVVVACDGKEIAKEVESFGGKYVITDPDLASGTDRIFAAYQELQKNSQKKYKGIINLQGDLPNIDPNIIKQAASSLKEGFDIATIGAKIIEKQEIDDPNVVKIAIAFDELYAGKALYFSRSPIPYSADKSANYFHHIGIYAYRPESLEKFISLEVSPLEKQEKLEQLRALENGMKIAVKIIQEKPPIGVDSKQDLDNAIAELV